MSHKSKSFRFSYNLSIKLKSMVCAVFMAAILAFGGPGAWLGSLGS